MRWNKGITGVSVLCLSRGYRAALFSQGFDSEEGLKNRWFWESNAAYSPVKLTITRLTDELLSSRTFQISIQASQRMILECWSQVFGIQFDILISYVQVAGEKKDGR